MAKDKFDDLLDEFKDAVAQSSPEEIKRRIADITILKAVEEKWYDNDPDIEQAQKTLKDLKEQYTESIKEMKLKLEWCFRVLDDKGAMPGRAPKKKAAQQKPQK